MSVCLSQVGVQSKRLNESSWLFFHPSYTVLKENWGFSKNKALFSGNLSQTPELEKILLKYIDRRNVLSTELETGGRSERDKLDRRRPTKLTIPPSSDARPLVYHTLAR